MRRLRGSKRDAAGDGPGDHRGNHDNGILQVDRQVAFVFADVAAKLADQHAGQGLVAGDHTGKNRGGKHGRKIIGFFGQLPDQVFNAGQQAGFFKDPGIGRRDQNDEGDLYHGDDPAAVDQGRQGRIRAAVAEYGRRNKASG